MVAVVLPSFAVMDAPFWAATLGNVTDHAPDGVATVVATSDKTPAFSLPCFTVTVTLANAAAPSPHTWVLLPRCRIIPRVNSGEWKVMPLVVAVVVVVEGRVMKQQSSSRATLDTLIMLSK